MNNFKRYVHFGHTFFICLYYDEFMTIKKLLILIAFILGFTANEFGVQFCKCFKLTDTKRFEKHLLTKHIDF